MKKIFLYSFLFLSGVSYSQESIVGKPSDAKARNTKTATVQTTFTDLEKATLQQFAVTNGSYLTQIASKDVVFEGEISLDKALLVNPDLMNITIGDNVKYFNIVDSNKVLVVKSWILLNIEKNGVK